MIKKNYKVGGIHRVVLKYKSYKDNDKERIIALYEVHGGSISYEVQILRYLKSGFTGEYSWRNPNNEDFGRYGWSYQNLDSAEEKYNGLLSTKSY